MPRMPTGHRPNLIHLRQNAASASLSSEWIG
jgi:hypothetical protein